MSFSFNGHHSDANSAAEGAPPGEVSAARLAPRVVTTGRKSTQNKPEYAGIDSETGEPVELLHSGSRLLMLRHMEPVQDVPETIAFVDALAFSVVPPEEESFHWLLQEMGQFLEIGTVEHRKGLFGFRYSARFGDGAGVIAWGGESQNDRVYFSV
jgi:phage replication initiation protein